MIDVVDEKPIIVPEPRINGSVIEPRQQLRPWEIPYVPHVMTQIDKLHAENIIGRGVKVAIIDSGIDYKHSLLGGCFGKRCLVSFGVDLVGDDYNGHNTPLRDDDPMDCNGHGTHVAGIIAARKNALGFVGAAPGVRLGAYRVMGCKGTTSNDIVIAAILEAYEDGAHIINISISAMKSKHSKPLSKIVQRLARHGVPCVLSTGNEGWQGQFYASAASNGHNAVTVTSFNPNVDPFLEIESKYWIESNGNSRQHSCLGQLRHLGVCPFARRPGGESFACTVGIPSAWGVSRQLYATSFDPVIGDDACSALPDNVSDLGNFIVLVRNGGCGHARKARNIAQKGARYMILYGDQDENIKPLGDRVTAEHLRAIAAVPSSIGQTWIRALASGANVLVNIPPVRRGGKVVNKENKATGGAVHDLSTWGPTYNVGFEPRIGAPGARVLSTYPRALGGFAIVSGTSMASPMVAAIFALVFEARQGNINADTIQDLLYTTAKAQLVHFSGRSFEILAPVSQQGSGMVQAFDAAYTSTHIKPSTLTFNDTENSPENLQIIVSNTKNVAIKYILSHSPSATAYTLARDIMSPTPYPDNLIPTYATLSFTRNGVPIRRFTLEAGQRAIIEVTPHPPTDVNPKRLPLWSGYVTINGSDESALSVAYQGVSGSLRGTVILPPGQAWISAAKVDDFFPRAPDDTTFLIPARGKTDPNFQYPIYVTFHVLASPLTCAYIIPLRGEEELAPIGQIDSYPKVSDPRGRSWDYWDGLMNNGEFVPPGRYKITFKSLRIFGDRSRSEDWDVVKTQPFYLQYKL